MNYIKKTFFLLFCFYGLCLSGQNKEVSGQVFDDTDMPLPGVNVTVKNTDRGTNTDFNGKFTLQIAEVDTTALIFSSLGFVKKEVALDGKTTLTVKLQKTTSDLNEVVVVGYGQQRKEDLTGAVSTVDTRDLESRPTADLARGLQGTTPGLEITSSTGEIGTEPNIRLRGQVGSIGSGSASQPLILVDNVEVPSMDYVNPKDVESISVLKDAASTSIYGARGAWGVILITTKEGKRETAPRVSYSSNFSWSTPTTMPKIAPGAAGAEMALKALQRTDPSVTTFGIVGMNINEESVERIRDWEEQYGDQNLGLQMKEGRDFERKNGKLYFYRPWDPLDMFMKQWTPQQKHNVSVSGGSEKTNYHLGLGYLSQEGVFKPNQDKFERYNLNLKLSTDIRDWWTARANIMYTDKIKQTPNGFSSATYDSWYYVTRWPSIYPYGTFEGEPFRSAITEMKQANMNKDKNNFTRLSLGSTFKPITGLSIDIDYTHDKVNSHSYQNGGEVVGYDFWSTGPDLESTPYTSPTYDRVVYGSSWSKRNTLKAFATYDRDIDNHSFKITVGNDLEEYEFWNQNSERRDLLDFNKVELPLATGDQYVSGGRNKWSTLGFFGRINYAFKDRYLIEINGRYDGSSRLSADHKWGFFPSVSAGYLVSKEDFMDFVKPTLSFLKFRASYGSIGNQDANVGNIYRIMSASNSNWIIDDDNQVTVGTPAATPSSLTWETVTTLDIGMDARFFDNALGLNFDWYQRTVSDMHTAGATLPSSFGTSAPKRNFGEMQTRGWELAVDYRHSFSNGLHISAKATLSDYKQKVTKFTDASDQIPNPITPLNSTYYEGMTLGEIWGYETDRLFTEDDFDDEGNYAAGVADQDKFIENSWFEFGPGDVKYKDINGDEKIDYGDNTRENPGDQKIIGNSTPRYQYGLILTADWKGFDFSLFVQGVGQRHIWANGPVMIPGYRPNEGWYAHHMDYWTPENTDAFYPKLSDAGQQVNPTNFQPQSRYLLDMSYLRMKNITFGYTIPKSITEKLGLQRIRVYFSGENLFEFDNLDIPIDPEIDYTAAGLNDTNSFGRVYPYQRKISFGLDVSL